MITHRTVLVLGAGASAPYGFPLGSQLLRQICSMLRNEKEIAFFSGMGFGKDHISTFRDALYYSGRYSVDAFLEYRPEFVEIGKSAIAKALVPYEQQHTLFEAPDNWYQYLYSRLNTSFETFSQNSLSVVTYNYDRSLEHYLFTALQNSYGKSDDECAQALLGIPIVHLHGQLGYLPWQNANGVRRYSSEVGTGDVKVSGRLIKIIHESIDRDQEFEQAHELLSSAESVYFLGFGYDRINLSRLKLRKGPAYRGTCLGMSNREVQMVIKMCRELFMVDIVELKQYNPHNFLREHFYGAQW